MTGLASSISQAMVGTGPVGPTGPVQPTAGIFGTGGQFDLTGALTLASAGLSLFSGYQQSSAIESQTEAQARALMLQSRDEEIAAEREETLGLQEANNILEETLKVTAAQRLAFSASGKNMDVGSPVSFTEATLEAGRRQYSTARDDARSRALSRRRQANEYQLSASNTLRSGSQRAGAAILDGVTSAGRSVASQALRRSERG